MKPHDSQGGALEAPIPRNLGNCKPARTSGGVLTMVQDQAAGHGDQAISVRLALRWEMVESLGGGLSDRTINRTLRP